MSQKWLCMDLFCVYNYLCCWLLEQQNIYNMYKTKNNNLRSFCIYPFTKYFSFRFSILHTLRFNMSMHYTINHTLYSYELNENNKLNFKISGELFCLHRSCTNCTLQAHLILKHNNKTRKPYKMMKKYNKLFSMKCHNAFVVFHLYVF